MMARTIAAFVASAMCLSVVTAQAPNFAVYDSLNTIVLQPAEFTFPLSGCCLQWTQNNMAFQNFSSYAAGSQSSNTHCSNETQVYEYSITAPTFSMGVYSFHYACWDNTSTMTSAADQLDVFITLSQAQNPPVSGSTLSGNNTSPMNDTSSAGFPMGNVTSSTGPAGNATLDVSSASPADLSSSSGSGDNSWLSSSSGSPIVISSSASIVLSSSSGANVNGTSSTGVIVNGTSSTGGEFGNATSSTGTMGNATSSTGSSVNATSSTGASVNGTSSSGSVATRSSSTGAVANPSSSTGAVIGSSTGAVKPVPSSSTGTPASGPPPNTMSARFEIELNGTTVPPELKNMIRTDLCNVIAQQFNTTFEVVDPFCLVEVGTPVPAARRLLAARVPITFTLLGNITSVVDTGAGGEGPVRSPMAAVSFIRQAIETGTPILTTTTSSLGIVVPVQTVVVEDLTPTPSSSTGLDGPAPEESSSGLAGGAVAGIVIGVLAAVLILSVVGYAAVTGKACFKGSASVGVAHATTTPVHVKATKDAEVV